MIPDQLKDDPPLTKSCASLRYRKPSVDRSFHLTPQRSLSDAHGERGEPEGKLKGYDEAEALTNEQS